MGPKNRGKTTAASNRGSFAPHLRDEDADVDLLTPGSDRDLSAWEPAEIDTALADLYYERMRATQRRDSDYDFLAGEIARHVYNRGWRGSATSEEVRQALTDIEETPESDRTFAQRDILKVWERVEKHQAAIDEALIDAEPYEAEYAARPWPRAFLVTNAGGHVHKDMNCSTCFPTTQYHWVTEMSGKDEAEIVDAAGERACTVCYPSAPVATLSKPTSLFTPEEIEKAKAREERAAAKAERDRKRIEKSLTVDGSEFVVTSRGYRESFKTEQAATSWAVEQLLDERTGYRQMAEDTREGVEAIKDAISAKHVMTGAEVDAMLEKKVLAKAKRDGYTL